VNRNAKYDCYGETTSDKFGYVFFQLTVLLYWTFVCRWFVRCAVKMMKKEMMFSSVIEQDAVGRIIKNAWTQLSS
jgi:predicted transcriptional regulator